MNLFCLADFDFVIADIVDILGILDTQGSSAVTWYRLKYHIIRFITPTNLLYIGKKLFEKYGGGAGGVGGLVYNFRSYINNVFLADIQNEDCRASLSLWFDAIAKPLQNLWAVRMFDATGKPPTNLLSANTNWMGNWNSCHRVKYKGGTFDFRGRYCRAKVRADPSLLLLAGPALDGFPGNPAELAAIDMGICVPDLCYGEDLAVIVNNTLKLLTIHYKAYIDDVGGVICEGPTKPEGTYYFTLVIITILTVLVIIATLYDCLYRMFLVKPFATASSLSLQNVHSLCNFSSSKPVPHGIYYKHLEAYQYQYSNRLRLHGMTYPSENERKAALVARKAWYNQVIFRIHRIAIDLSAYTAILKPMSSTGKSCIISIINLFVPLRCDEMLERDASDFHDLDHLGSYLQLYWRSKLLPLDSKRFGSLRIAERTNRSAIDHQCSLRCRYFLSDQCLLSLLVSSSNAQEEWHAQMVFLAHDVFGTILTLDSTVHLDLFTIHLRRAIHR